MLVESDADASSTTSHPHSSHHLYHRLRSTIDIIPTIPTRRTVDDDHGSPWSHHPRVRSSQSPPGQASRMADDDHRIMGGEDEQRGSPRHWRHPRCLAVESASFGAALVPSSPRRSDPDPDPWPALSVRSLHGGVRVRRACGTIGEIEEIGNRVASRCMRPGRLF